LTVLSFERFSVTPEAEVRVREIATTVLDALRAAPGALWAELATAADGGFLLVSEWRTAPDADAWGTGEAAANFAQELDPHLVGEYTRRRFDGRP
jgi:quinol monooxygenase YgiN